MPRRRVTIATAPIPFRTAFRHASATRRVAENVIVRIEDEHGLVGLGETFYVRGQYRTAAAAFLKGYQDYAKSQKAPESLLKLAMSLHRLGQKDAACSSFTELATKYPTPPAHIRTLAQTERRRSGC